MPMRDDALHRLRRQAHAAYVIAKKDAIIYYLKPPVISFGIVFPLFFYLAFAAGRSVPAGTMVPGIVAMALFFTASAIGPLVTPWERQARTFERLVTSPASLEAILLGDVLAGMAFGTLLSFVPLLLGTAIASAHIAHPECLIPGLALGALAFSALGVLMAAPPTDAPSQIMMLSSLVRLPLIFISGVFVRGDAAMGAMAVAAVAALIQRRPDPGRIWRHPLLPVAGRHRGADRVRRSVPRCRAIHSPSNPRQGSINRLDKNRFAHDLNHARRRQLRHRVMGINPDEVFLMLSTRKLVAIGAALVVAATGVAIAQTMPDDHSMGPDHMQQMMASGQHPRAYAGDDAPAPGHDADGRSFR